MATSRKSSNGKSTKSTSSGRKKPGSGGQGDYYHVEVREGGDFETFRTQDVGDAGHLQRVGGKRASGSWATVKWLISKEDAHVENGKLSRRYKGRERSDQEAWFTTRPCGWRSLQGERSPRCPGEIQTHRGSNPRKTSEYQEGSSSTSKWLVQRKR